MNIESDILQAVSKIATVCNLRGPETIMVRSGFIYASGYDEQGYFFVKSTGRDCVKAQDPLLHEAGHLVRLYSEKTLGVGLGLVEELDRVSKLVDKSISEQGILGDNYLTLCSLLFEKRASEELIGCYFGMDLNDQGALAQATQARSPKTLLVFREKLHEWEKIIRDAMHSPEGVNYATIYLDFSGKIGKFYGGIIGHMLAEEQANPRVIMLHDSTKFFESITGLAAQERFPDNLESFFQGTKLLVSPV